MNCPRLGMWGERPAAARAVQAPTEHENGISIGWVASVADSPPVSRKVTGTTASGLEFPVAPHASIFRTQWRMDQMADHTAPAPGAQPQRPPRKLAAVNGVLLKLIEQRCFADDPEYQNGLRMTPSDVTGGLPYHLFLPAEAAISPEEVFSALRWGGRAVLVAAQPGVITDLAQRFSRWEGWVLEQPPAWIRQRPWGLPLPGLGRRVHYAVLRKVDLMKPGETTDRFTYFTRLGHVDSTDGYVVVKRVPTLDRVVARLRYKFPELSLEDLHRRARKFTDKIFPVLLTREAAMLDILQRDMPEPLRERVPRCLKAEKDARGFVHTLYMNWLRNGGREMSQLQFALQSAELLTALHETAGVLHLDLRLDNFVITQRGVGFIDFGSSVRDRETFAPTSLLATLFQEMMRTCQVQRTLDRLCQQRQVTNPVLRGALHRVDKAVDLFHLTLLINKPTAQPEFKGLVHYDPASPEAQCIRHLTDEVLRPPDPDRPRYRTARDLLQGLRRLEKDLAHGPIAPPPSPPPPPGGAESSGPFASHSSDTIAVMGM